MCNAAVAQTAMALNSPNNYRQGTGTGSVFKTSTRTPIINASFERSSANQLKQEVISLKRENQNLRQELLKLQWQMHQQRKNILATLGESTGDSGLAALGEPTGDSGVPEGFI
ncbi:hypothetical protein O988_00323 [Pseudogymnoascus sp. VKM F-3808]|nr:hypothetical protein O988_00323 [Pseudogymnoascus sp. VKM F-3808]